MLYEGNKTKNISFPLGGIGTGCIGLTGNGELTDWEIFNRPNKNSFNGYTHFAIRAKTRDKITARVLQGDTNENYMGTYMGREFLGYGFGPRAGSLAGFPHFRSVRFKGEFPLATLTFQDADFPANVRLCAFNPMIPHNDFDSSLPAAFFEWEIENTTEEEVEYAVAFSVQNPAQKSKNYSFQNAEKQGIFLQNAEKTETEIGYCDLCMCTDGTDVDKQAYWYRGAWQDSITTFWNEFSSGKRITAREYETAGENDHATLVSYVKIPAGEKRRLRFVLAWNAPVCYNYWSEYKNDKGEDITWKNYYATQFKDSRETANYATSHFLELQEKTLRFSRALQESSLPDFVIDAISANLSVLKSAAVLRYEDGAFWGWEGCHEKSGSCEGSCQHVWNYAYALPFLFPALERSMRESVMKYALFESGHTVFRVPLPLGRKPAVSRACVDGQMGEVVKCYREWKISGDSAWLKAHAEKIYKMLEFAWSKENWHAWDRDCDGVMEGRQHHTLDMELFGPSSWLQGFYLLALDCGSKIAEFLGDKERAEKYRKLYENGKKWTNENLFNGEYFTQKVDIKDKTILDKYEAGEYWNEETGEIKYQVDNGSIIDQTLSDWHAAILCVDGVFDKDKKAKALQSLYKYNYKKSMREVANAWRNFSLNDESGTIICAYPDGVKKPSIPVPYCDETMTGFEYALAGLMVTEGMEKEGETLVKAVRDRYDGEKRNPWNEIECGSNYARSMASYALLPIYSGFSFDMSEGHIGFSPRKKGDGKYFWSVARSYGEMRLEGKRRTLSVFETPLALSFFSLPEGEQASRVVINGEEVAFSQTGRKIAFAKTEIKEMEITIK